MLLPLDKYKYQIVNKKADCYTCYLKQKGFCQKTTPCSCFFPVDILGKELEVSVFGEKIKVKILDIVKIKDRYYIKTQIL